MNGWKKGKHPWNKGLTKETDLRVMKMSTSQLGSKNHMYGRHMSEEIKLKISEGVSGENNPFYRHKHTEEFKKKHSVRMSGKNHPNYGKPSPMKGMKQNETSRIKMSMSRRGKKFSEEHKKNLSDSLKGRSPPPLAGIGHGSYYESPLQGKIWLRSTYEIAYAKYLDSIKELWYYEIEKFELQYSGTYTPDFFLPRQEKFIEIKGYLFPEDKIKIQKFQEEYPWNLEVLYKKDLLSLGIIVK